MRVSLLVFVTAMARFAVSRSIVSPMIQPRQTANQSSHNPFISLIDGATNKPPACSVSTLPPHPTHSAQSLFAYPFSFQIQCVMQSMQSAPAASSSGDPIQALCSKKVVPGVTDRLQTCLFSSCTLQELLQAKRFTAALCREPRTDLRPMIMAVTWALGALSMVTVALRVLARTAILETSRFEANRWSWDDTVIMVATVVNLASGVFVSLGKLLCNLQ